MRTGRLHADERGVWIDAGRITIHAHQTTLDLLNGVQRAADVSCKQGDAQPVLRAIRQRDGLLDGA